jgi:hypothetical protein
MASVRGDGLAAQGAADSAAAIGALGDFGAACRRDGGRLWGRSLCGPLILVDGATGFAAETARPPAGTFSTVGQLFVGRVPVGMQVANTAMDWGGVRWSTVRLPLPDERFALVALLIHEAFHRIQPAIGLQSRDPVNPHLDERDGRYLLRLELRALRRAITTSGATTRAAATDALLFRARRYQLYPGADTLESALEVQEGLAEYTGIRIALSETRQGPARVARSIEEFESRPTYVRALGYGTGPGLGLLLDRFAPGWRQRVRTDGFSRQLSRALGSKLPADLAGAVAQRATRYQGEILAREEDDRARVRAERVAGYRASLVEGPVIVLGGGSLMRSFNPNNLFPLGPDGTVYPTGAFTSDWGTLQVDSGAALVRVETAEVRIAAPPDLDPSSTTVTGAGWKLELAPGWKLEPGPRPGDFTAVKTP